MTKCSRCGSTEITYDKPTGFTSRKYFTCTKCGHKDSEPNIAYRQWRTAIRLALGEDDRSRKKRMSTNTR